MQMNTFVDIQPDQLSFDSHPAYQWALHNTEWTYDECEMFACYTNSFKTSSGEFTQPMDFMSSWFKQEYLGDNW